MNKTCYVGKHMNILLLYVSVNSIVASVIYLFFAEDSLQFTSATWDNYTHIKEVLTRYGKTSGQ